MGFYGTGINTQPVFVERAGVEIINGAGRAVKYDADGCIVLAGAGEVAYGVLAIDTEATIKVGDEVIVQYKDVGMVRMGGVCAKGDLLEVGANGKLIKAAGGNVVACALGAGSDGEYVRARMLFALATKSQAVLG